MSRAVLAVLALALAGAAACKKQGETARIRVGDHPVTVELAATPEQRSKGLMHRDHLPEDQGMLFVYPEVETRSFWMKNTRIPLSIAYVNDEGTILRIADMEPLSTERTHSLYPVRYALEMNKGWFEEHDVEKGDRITDLPDVEPR